MRAEDSRILADLEAELSSRLTSNSLPTGESPVLAGGNFHYELCARTRAVDCGGLGVVQALVSSLGLSDTINEKLRLLKQHQPYLESDHVLNVVYNIVSGGTRLEEIKAKRHSVAYLDALGADRIPDSSTAGDFLRRFQTDDVLALMDVVNETRARVWRRQPAKNRKLAIFDVDGTIVPTSGNCKEGADFCHDGTFGYGPLLVTLANSGEVMFVVNRGANRPSHENAPSWLDKASGWAASVGFKKVRLRGDTDFSLTRNFDSWTERGIEFVFGMDANQHFVKRAEALDETCWRPLRRRQPRKIKSQPRRRPKNYRQEVVRQREYRNLRLDTEHVAEIEYTPSKCSGRYRLVCLRKTIAVEEGQALLFGQRRYLFYITNISRRTLGSAEVVFESNARCNQENLIGQFKHGVHATTAPAVEFIANWAYMVICCLAWNLKAWLGLLLPAHLGARDLLRMEFRRFLNEVIRIPAQILISGRKLIFRLLDSTQRARFLIEATAWLRHARC
jgi:hypothetical protein